MTSGAYQGPLPVKQPESDFYWEKAQAHELWLRRCNACEHAYFYPRDFCPDCGSRDVSWVQASGRGTLHTFAIVHRAPVPAFRDHVPFVVAMVDLEEGARVPTNLVGVEPGSLRTSGSAWRLRSPSQTSPTRSRCRCSGPREVGVAGAATP